VEGREEQSNPSERGGVVGRRGRVSLSRTTARTEFFERLQNEVRLAINFFPAGENQKREGVDPSALRRHIISAVGPEHRGRIRLRKKASAAGGELEYALSYDGELLFRLVWVPWPQEFYGHDGRWHVRRHPAATWWRQDQDRRRSRRGGRGRAPRRDGTK
jgi:hypothetical protein